MQDIVMIDNILRFKENKIVSDVLDNSYLDLNKIAMRDYTDEERMQFAQLIGYSVSGYCDLSYVSYDSCEIADLIHYEGLSDKDAEIKHLKKLLTETREKVKDLSVSLFRIAPEDLEY